MPVELNTTKPPDVNQMSATQKRIKMAMGNYPEQQTVMDAKISQQPVTDVQIAENNKIVGKSSEPPLPSVTEDYIQPNAVDFGAKLTPELASKIMREGGLPALYSAMNKESAYEGQEAVDKREKKERQRALITSIADGLSSIANLGGAMAGGISQNQASLSEANTKRREYQRQLREKDRDKWQAMMGRAAEMQQNYELAKDKQALMNEKRLGDIYIKEMELALKSAKTQGDIDKIYATIDRIYGDLDRKQQEYDLKVQQFNEQVNKNNWQKEVGYIKAGASQTSAGASVQRANKQTRHNLVTEDQAERGVGKSATSPATSASPMFSPKPPVQPAKPAKPAASQKKPAKPASNSIYNF